MTLSETLAYRVQCAVNGVKRIYGERRFQSRRRALSLRYLEGDGIEIGALHEPLVTGDRARVRYLDRLTVAELRLHYPELAAAELVDVDFVDDGETLRTQADSQWDFLIANHVIEHCESPILAFGNWLRVVRSGGILYIAVPDRRHTFDRNRPSTPLSHLIRDFEEGPAISRRQHYLEWSREVCAKSGPEAEHYADELLARRYSIHFHVWDREEFVALLEYLRMRTPFRVEALESNGMETITVLRKV